MLFFANENTGVLNLRGLNVKFRDMKLCHMALSPSCFFQKKVVLYMTSTDNELWFRFTPLLYAGCCPVIGYRIDD